jgi:DNA-binding HxlR family transcriptional regulator
VAIKRSYGDGCAVAHSLDLVGERWALLVVRELMYGPKRFTDLRAGIPGGSASMLAQRLRELEEAGIVVRRQLGPPASSRVYELTPWGHELRPVLATLGRWGARSPFMQHDAELSADSFMLALETLFDPQVAAGMRADLALRIGRDGFHVRIDGPDLRIARGEPGASDATVEADLSILNSLIWDGRELPEAIRAGDVMIDGDVDLVKRFVRLFPLPAAAPAPAPTDAGDDHQAG